MKIVIIGAGGFGRETVDVVRAINRASDKDQYDLLGVVDSSPSEANLRRLRALGVPYLGADEAWGASPICEATEYVIAIGSPTVRFSVANDAKLRKRRAATLVHPTANIGSNVAIGEGTIICGGVNVSTNVSFGTHTHLNPGSVIGHDCTVGDFVSVNPAATVSGDVTIESKCLLGAGSVVLQGLTVETASVVGAGAVVVRNVASGASVKGVPAR